MTTRSPAQLVAEINRVIVDNHDGRVTPATLRALMLDFADRGTIMGLVGSGNLPLIGSFDSLGVSDITNPDSIIIYGDSGREYARISLGAFNAWLQEQLGNDNYLIPDGGTTGQVLAKRNNNDRAVTWVDHAEEYTDAHTDARILALRPNDYTDADERKLDELGGDGIVVANGEFDAIAVGNTHIRASRLPGQAVEGAFRGDTELVQADTVNANGTMNLAFTGQESHYDESTARINGRSAKISQRTSFDNDGVNNITTLTFAGDYSDWIVVGTNTWEIIEPIERASATRDGLMSNQDFSKLATIQAGAQVNPTGAQIKTLYENNNNTNSVTDANKVTLDQLTNLTNINSANKYTGWDGRGRIAALDAPSGGGGTTPLGTALPLVEGTASAGTSTSASRQDHRHPVGSVANGAITALKLASNAVTNAKINNGAVGLTKLAQAVVARLLSSGGTSGQVLAKKSGTAYDVEWTDSSGGGLNQAEVNALVKAYTQPLTTDEKETLEAFEATGWDIMGQVAEAVATEPTASQIVNYDYAISQRAGPRLSNVFVPIFLTPEEVIRRNANPNNWRLIVRESTGQVLEVHLSRPNTPNLSLIHI